MFSRFAVVAALVLGTSAVSQARTILVPEDQPTIQAGLDAGQPGDTVLVAPDTYSGPENRNLDFRGKDMTLLADNETLPVIIDCNGLGRGFWFHSGETTFAVVNGFHIRNGVGFFDFGGGGAIYVAESGPSIRNCTIEENVGLGDGGGILIRNVESNFVPEIVGCVIRGNIDDEDSHGGGIHIVAANAILRDCTITGNSARHGGGLYYASPAATGYDLTISGCSVTGNYAAANAGGMFIASPLALERSIVWGNCSGANEPDLYVTNGTTVLALCSCLPSGIANVEYYGESIFSDPLFCDPVTCEDAPTIHGLYYLQSTSPCTAGNSPCGEQIGALPADCTVAGAMPGSFPVGRAIWASPNPSGSACELRFDLDVVVGEEAVIRDVQGRRIAKLSIPEAGPGKLVWDGTDDSGRAVPAGIYFASVQTRQGMQTARIIRVQ